MNDWLHEILIVDSIQMKKLDHTSLNDSRKCARIVCVVLTSVHTRGEACSGLGANPLNLSLFLNITVSYTDK